MKGIKRSQTDTIHDDYNNNNKKPKLQNETITINGNKSLFEDLANEILYEIFDYLDIYYAYKGFLNLNHRFKGLLLHSNLPLQINISTLSKSTFDYYYGNILLPNKHRINFLRLSNPFTVDIIFSPPSLISKFPSLETFILDQISGKYLINILKHAALLPKLHSLILHLADHIDDVTKLFMYIFRLPQLKSCQITYQTKNNQNPLLLLLAEYRRSSIEHLVINGRFPYDQLDELFLRLPKLRYLSINCIFGCRFMDISPIDIPLKYLKYVSLKLDGIQFKRLENLIQYFFHYVEVFRLTTRFHEEYLDAKRWEDLIVSSMPNLRVFDINHIDYIHNKDNTYHQVINRFNSIFWMEKQWFFTHQHDWQETLDGGIFYSTDPYRRKDYAFYWAFDSQICSHRHEHNLNSVQHLHVCSKQARNHSTNYFPNATELTIKHHFQTFDDSISTTLNRLLPLQQLSKLTIECYHYPFEEILQLLQLTPHLHTLKLDLLSIDDNAYNIIQQSEAFQYVSKMNKIQHLDLRDWCKLEKIHLLVNLFPRLEYLKTGMNRKEMDQILRYLLAKTNQQTRRLVFLCISRTPKICLKELTKLIKLEKLLKHYSMKFVNRDLYLWW